MVRHSDLATATHGGGWGHELIQKLVCVCCGGVGPPKRAHIGPWCMISAAGSAHNGTASLHAPAHHRYNLPAHNEALPHQTGCRLRAVDGAG